MPRRKASSAAPAANEITQPKPPGSFTHDGRWDEEAWTRSELSIFVFDLAQTRRMASVAPSYAAAAIRDRGYASAFSEQTLDEWACLDRHEHWPIATARRGVEIMVKYAGYRHDSQHEWRGGYFLPKSTATYGRPEPPVEIPGGNLSPMWELGRRVGEMCRERDLSSGESAAAFHRAGEALANVQDVEKAVALVREWLANRFGQAPALDEAPALG